MSYFEIYNEQVYDLLGEVIPLQSPLGSQSSDRGNRGATMMEDPRRGIQMPEIKLYQITTLAQVYIYIYIYIYMSTRAILMSIDHRAD